MYRTEANCLPHPYKSVIHYNITERYTKCGPCLSNASRKLISETLKKVGNLTNNYFTTIPTKYRLKSRIINNATNFFTKM